MVVGEEANGRPFTGVGFGIAGGKREMLGFECV